jgi:hypothetical protein
MSKRNHVTRRATLAGRHLAQMVCRGRCPDTAWSSPSQGGAPRSSRTVSPAIRDVATEDSGSPDCLQWHRAALITAVRRLVTPHSNLADRESKDRYRHKRVQLLVKITAGPMSRGSTKASDYREPQTMSARRIFAVVCAALALTFVSGSAALAYSTDSGNAPSLRQARRHRRHQ